MDTGIILLLCLGGICGLLVALIFHRCRDAVVFTIIFSPLVGIAAQMIAGFIWGIQDAHEHGYSPDRSIQSGMGAAFLLAFSAPFTCGLPAALVGFTSQKLFQKCRQNIADCGTMGLGE